MGIVADGVALAGFRFQREPGVEFLEPAGLSGRENHVREQTTRAGLVVDFFARGGHLLIGQEPVLLDVGRCRGDQCDLGVAVEKHLFFVVVEFQILDGLLVVIQFLVPAGLADRLAHVDEGGDAGVVAQEMSVHVHDELVLERIGALLGHRRSGGFRWRDIEQRPINFVHRHKGRGHAGSGLEKPATVEALLAAEIVGHREQPGLDFALPLVLRIGIEFIAGHDLGRDRRLVLAQFGRHQRGKFCSVSWLLMTSCSLACATRSAPWLDGRETRPGRRGKKPLRSSLRITFPRLHLGVKYGYRMAS